MASFRQFYLLPTPHAISHHKYLCIMCHDDAMSFDAEDIRPLELDFILTYVMRRCLKCCVTGARMRLFCFYVTAYK